MKITSTWGHFCLGVLTCVYLSWGIFLFAQFSSPIYLAPTQGAQNTEVIEVGSDQLCWDHFVNAPSQWETMLQCNVASHWLGAFTKWTLIIPHLSWLGHVLQTNISQCQLSQATCKHVITALDLSQCCQHLACSDPHLVHSGMPTGLLFQMYTRSSEVNDKANLHDVFWLWGYKLNPLLWYDNLSDCLLHIDRLVQKRRNSSVLAMQLCLALTHRYKHFLSVGRFGKKCFSRAVMIIHWFDFVFIVCWGELHHLNVFALE